MMTSPEPKIVETVAPHVDPVPMRASIERVDPGEFAPHHPDAHLQLHEHGTVAAHCSLWWQETPVWQGHRVGLIGHYFAGSASGQVLLEHSCEQLRERGCTFAIGPMDGSTWRSYRFITRFGDEPRFLFEPENSAEWVEQFARCGFEPIAQYFSALNEDLTCVDPRIVRHRYRWVSRNIAIRPVRRDCIHKDLNSIYAVIREAFRDNPLYADLDEAEFVGTYLPLLGRVPLELILLAEHGEKPVGFVFAVPNFLESSVQTAARAGAATYRTLIIKTLAALPERQYAGLGQLLLAEVQQRASQLGFQRAIHALVRDTPHLRRISARYARPIREYSLFGRILQR